MHTRSATTAAARMPRLDRPASAGRQSVSSPADRLWDLSYRLDNLIGDVSHGTLTHRQHEANVEEAEAIANDLRAVFRGKDSRR